MVFPLGTYAAASYATARLTGWDVLRTVSLVFCWIAVAAWLVVAVAGGRRAHAVLTSPRPSTGSG